MNAFENVDDQQSRLVMLEAVTMSHQASLRVQLDLLERLAARAGLSKLENMSVENYLKTQRRKELAQMVATLADHDPSLATLISVTLKTIDPDAP